MRGWEGKQKEEKGDSRGETYTLHPFSAKISAALFPIPPSAPVIRVVLPARDEGTKEGEATACACDDYRDEYVRTKRMGWGCN